MPSVTAVPEPGNVPPRVLLTVNLADVVPIPTSAYITRNDPDGRVRTIRLADPAVLNAGLWTGYDYESPFGTPVTYSVLAGSATYAATPVTLAVDEVWLRHPGLPSLSLPVQYQRRGSLGVRTRASSRAVFTPMGRRTPIVLSGVSRQSPESALSVLTRSEGERSQLWDLLDDDSVLLLTVPASRGWGVTHEYVSIGDVSEARITGLLATPERTFTLPYIVVDRPAGDLQSQFTWGDLLAEATTWAEVMASYDTWFDVLQNNSDEPWVGADPWVGVESWADPSQWINAAAWP